MKRVFIIIIILLLLSVAFFIMSENGVSYKDTSGITEISPYSKEVSALVRLFFIDEDELVSEMRTIKIERLETEKAIVNALKFGSKIQGYRSPFNATVEIGNVETVDRICYVDLSANFLELDENRLFINVMAIVNTLTELESIDDVQILIDGKKVRESIPELSEPVSKNNLLVQVNELNHKDIVRKFFEYISQGRYDLAYDLVDSESKIYYAYEDFREELIRIRNEIKGSIIRNIFAREEEGIYIVEVKYVKRNLDENDSIALDAVDPTELDYTYAVKMEDGLWKIVFK